jgi:thiosulfate reductase/polysulfide reductase chain A
MDLRVDRRAILKFGCWGAAAILSSKILGGVNSIAQTTPMDGVVKTHCGLCAWECGIDIRIQGGKIAGIEGMVEDPETRGGICPIGKDQARFLTDPERILNPLKRQGKKGEGKFQSISWPEALYLIKERWNQILKESGGESIAGFLGSDLSLDSQWMAQRLFSLLGSPNLFLSSTTKLSSWNFAGKTLTGGSPSFNLESLNQSRCIILWGTNHLLWGWNVGRQMIKDLLKRGAKLIVIDPRPTPLAVQASLWLRPRPGTDGLLAWSMAQVILDGNLHERDFLKEWTVGFGGYVEMASKIEYSPSSAEPICGVPAAQIREAARMFATLKPAMIIGGLGISQHSNAVQTGRVIQSLLALTGNVNVKGGNLFFSHPLESLSGPASLTDRLKESGAWQKKVVELSSGRMDSNRLWDLILADGRDGHWKEDIFRKAISEKGDPYSQADVYPGSYKGKAYKIRSLWVQGGNPLLCLPNSLKGKLALEKVEHLVVVDSFLTGTAAYADLVLPAALGLESFGLLGGQHSFIRPWLSLRVPAAKASKECRSHQEIIGAVGRAMGNGQEFDFTEEQFIEMVLKSSPQTVFMTFEKFLKTPSRKLPLFGMLQIFPTPYQKQNFSTPSGKIELQSQILMKGGFNPYPEWVPPVESPENTPEFYKKYPMILVTGEASWEELERLQKMKGQGWVEVSTSDAKKLLLKEGDSIVVESKIGRIRLLASISEKIKPGVIRVLAYSLKMRSPRSQGLGSVNVLIDDAFNDPISGASRSNEMLVRVYKG